MNVINFVPIMGRVALRYEKVNAINDILVPETAQGAAMQGKLWEVLAVPPDTTILSVGDRVYLTAEGQGQIMKIDDVDVLLVQMHQIVGKQAHKPTSLAL